jgi:hypothetical protein
MNQSLRHRIVIGTAEKHRTAVVRTAREERTDFVQFSPYVTIFMIGECRLYGSISTHQKPVRGLRKMPSSCAPARPPDRSIGH